jgi:hypothetical protein
LGDVFFRVYVLLIFAAYFFYSVGNFSFIFASEPISGDQDFSSCSKTLTPGQLHIIQEMAKFRIAISQSAGPLRRKMERVWTEKLYDAAHVLNLELTELSLRIKSAIGKIIRAGSGKVASLVTPPAEDKAPTLECADSSLTSAPIGTQCITHLGHTFTKVNHQGFGMAWQDPSGTVWSWKTGNVSNNLDNSSPGVGPNAATTRNLGSVKSTPATKMCEEGGGRLPSKRDYYRLKNYFGIRADTEISDEGKSELYALFPDMKGNVFWTSSLGSNPGGHIHSGFAAGFDGDKTIVKSYRRNLDFLLVRCVFDVK